MRTNCSIVSKWPDSGYPCHLHVLGWTCLGMTRDRGDVKWTYKQKGNGKYMLVRPQLEGQYKRWGRSDQINYTCWPLYSHKLFLKVGTTSKWFLDIFISYINTSAKFAGKSLGLGLVDASVLFMVKKRLECNALDQGQRPPKQGRSAPISVQSLQIPPFWLSCPEIEGEVEDIPESPPVLGSGRVGRNKDGLELPTSLQ